MTCSAYSLRSGPEIIGFQRESNPIEQTNLWENPFLDLAAAMITFVSITTLIIEKAIRN
jgi:hypothetical protein